MDDYRIERQMTTTVAGDGEPNTSWPYCGLCSAIIPPSRLRRHKVTDMHRIQIRAKWRRRQRRRAERPPDR